MYSTECTNTNTYSKKDQSRDNTTYDELEYKYPRLSLFFCYILKDKIVGSPQNLDNSIFSYITRQSFFLMKDILWKIKLSITQNVYNCRLQ